MRLDDAGCPGQFPSGLVGGQELTKDRAAGRQGKTPLLALTALGIVYGDLGTSPLYTMQTVIEDAGGHVDPRLALGILSLIFWTLIITISVKYCGLVMRADNHGEGGILALMSLIGRNSSETGRFLVYCGLFGAALIYGDGIITPAISVLSALGGVDVATKALDPYIMPLAVVILVALFAAQRFGTARIGRFFGPVMLAWFVMIGLLGVAGIVRHPAVLAAANPYYAMRLLAHQGWASFVVLGGVFLATTGGEALYADMGHIGRGPIRASWFLIVLPACVLNYAGETALLFGPDAARRQSVFFACAGGGLGRQHDVAFVGPGTVDQIGGQLAVDRRTLYRFAGHGDRQFQHQRPRHLGR